MKKFNGDHLLVVWTESGDEIHFAVIDYSFYDRIDELIDVRSMTQEDVEELLSIVYDNTLQDIMCQTYVLEDYNLNDYNIVKVIYQN